MYHHRRNTRWYIVNDAGKIILSLGMTGRFIDSIYKLTSANRSVQQYDSIVCQQSCLDSFIRTKFIGNLVEFIFDSRLLQSSVASNALQNFEEQNFLLTISLLLEILLFSKKKVVEKFISDTLRGNDQTLCTYLHQVWNTSSQLSRDELRI